MKITPIIKSAASALFALSAALFVPAAVAMAEEAPQGTETVPAPAAQQQQVVISQTEAFNLMSAEAAKGNSSALLTLGTMYERGMGTPRSFVKAFESYQQAAKAGLAEGYYNVGVCYEVGMGNAGSVELAFQNIEEAAKLGLTQALYKLAEMYISGIGTQKNEPWGVELLNRAAAKGHMVAANDLGVAVYEGRYGQTKDIEKAREWFGKSAELGYGEAMKNIGVMYRDGIGVTADPKEELKWLALARLAGLQTPAIETAMATARGKLSEDQIKEVEAAAQTWIEAFQQRQAAAQAAAAPAATPAQ